MRYQEIKTKTTSFLDAFAKMYQNKGDKGFITKSISFVVTEQCNLRCTYCYEVHKNNKRMTKEIGRQAIDALLKEYENEGRYINSTNSKAIILEFIGGEPFLEIDLINDIVEYFKYKTITTNHPWSTNYMISMTSNGTLYNTPKVQEFIKRNEGKVSITITIDGNKELHDSCRVFPDGKGSYDIVEKAIKKQIQNNPSKEINTKLTLAPANIIYFSEAIKNLYNLGLDGIHANCVYEEGWTAEHAKILYNEMKKVADFMIENDLYKDFFVSMFDELIGQPMGDDNNNNWCGGTGNMLAIDTNGTIYPCLRYLPFTIASDKEPMVIGDIYNGLEHTDKQKECVSCLKCITRRSQSTDECYNCPIATGCGWCSAYNYDQFGTPDKRATYICITHKARVLASSYFYNTIYKKEGLENKFNLNIPKEWALEIIDEDEYNLLKQMSE